MTLNGRDTSETINAGADAGRSLETLADLRRAAQRMYISQFETTQEGGAALSPQQMRIGISLLNLIRTTILDEARLARESAKQKTSDQTSSDAEASSTTPQDSESNSGHEQTGTVARDFDGEIRQKFDEDGAWVMDESGASEKPSGEVFHKVPGLVYGEVRQIIANDLYVPAPRPGEGSYIRPRGPRGSG
jgi:hypothetical protein